MRGRATSSAADRPLSLPLALALVLAARTCAANLQNAAVPTTPAAAVVHKCCGPDEVVVVNHCRSTNVSGVAPWTPEFAASDGDDTVTLPATSVAYK